MRPDPIDRQMISIAREQLAGFAALVDRADPNATVSPRSRMLCAGLAGLARACLSALASGPVEPALARAVGEAAAMLSLLTKIDDQVIDALGFHGGPTRRRDRVALDRRTRAYLAPTLASLRSGEPFDREPRCELAALLGRGLRALAGSRERLEHVLDTIAFGWEVQVRAVRLLSSDPAEVDPPAIAAVSADISGAWLLMVTRIGELPELAARTITIGEEQAFYRWGLAIQAADALADLGKDTRDGLVASWPGVLLDRAEPGRARWRAAFERDAMAELHAGMVEHAIDLAILPSPRELAELDAALVELGAVPRWLRWIHGFLTWRWLEHPLCPRMHASAAHRAVLLDESRGLGASWEQQLGVAIGDEEVHPCSAR
ncbi:hypothetical protein ACNOYE_34480 [Nannocystaceae bacterium ST9]